MLKENNHLLSNI